MAKIFVSDPMSDEGLDVLRSNDNFEVKVKTGLKPEELKSELQGFDALLVRSQTKVTPDIIQSAKDLKFIGRAGVGVDNIDIAAASRAGIVVANVPGGNTISAAEHAVAMLMSLVRNIPQANATLHNGKWEKKKFMGTEVYGKVLGVIGLGRIGKDVAQKAKGLGMQVIGYDPMIDESWCKIEGVKKASLDEIYKEADFITLHVPKSKETYHLINKDTLAKMKKGVRIINCARGGIIDEKDLLTAIQSGHVKGAALDVFEKEPPLGSPLLARPEVILTPHLGASTEEAQVKVAVGMAHTVIEYFEKGAALHAINLPKLEVSAQTNLSSYAILAQRLGSFISQIAEEEPKSLKLIYSGELGKYNPALITASALTGVLKGKKDRVTPVNALNIAKEAGISVTETAQPETKDFASLISIEIEASGKKHRVAGTVFGQEDIRLVRVDDRPIDIIPEGNMLVLNHYDKPGVVGFLGTVLGESGVNIAGLDVGRNKPGGEAVSILSVDNEVSEEVIKKIKTHQAVLNVRMVKL